MNIQTIFDQEWANEFQQRLSADGPWANWDMYRLATQVQKVTAIDSFEGLQAPAHLPAFTPLKHQLEVARRVVEEMNGKAILADEVGLGKTVEAGLIIKEYMIRGLAKKILILVPASLVSQWVQELRTKFYIDAVEQKRAMCGSSVTLWFLPLIQPKDSRIETRFYRLRTIWSLSMKHIN